MLPFQVEFKNGRGSTSQQVILAIRRALAEGRLQPGQPFPSSAQLARELRIHPSTAAEVIAELRAQNFIAASGEDAPAVTEAALAQSKEERLCLLEPDSADLVTAARRLHLSHDAFFHQLQTLWDSLDEGN